MLPVSPLLVQVVSGSSWRGRSWAKLEKAGASPRRGASRIDDPKAYQAEGVLFLTPSARFDYLLQRPEGSNVGKAVNEAMADIEKHNAQLAGVLPRNYQIFNGTLLKELLKKVSEIPVSLDFDAFGRIYEYFLGQFARTHFLDPACGSDGTISSWIASNTALN